MALGPSAPPSELASLRQHFALEPSNGRLREDVIRRPAMGDALRGGRASRAGHFRLTIALWAPLPGRFSAPGVWGGSSASL